VVQKKLRASLLKTPVDAVIQVGDLAYLDEPYYIYQDLSFDILERLYETTRGVPGFGVIDLETIKRRRDRQHKIYESANGVFAMSQWFANTLIEWSGISPGKITVVYAGLNSIGAIKEKTVPGVEATRNAPVKLLFVGRDFYRKGGDLVLEAMALLRRDRLPNVQLTIVGPDRWPLPTSIPEGVVFLGSCTPPEVAQLFCEHDLFVMPSRFEAFGIAFVEALAHGIPVIGRSAFAMPEFIQPGKNGALVRTDDPAELASTIIAVLDNPTIRQYTLQTMQGVRAQFSWEAVAERMVVRMVDPK
jgi:glycosyltransferase involved in cell wall biosynthesis